jgi:hypothetical protein
MSGERYTGFHFEAAAYGHRLACYGYARYWEYSQESLEWLAAHVPEDKHHRCDLKMRRAWEAALASKTLEAAFA